jgi:hypothetical protein
VLARAGRASHRALLAGTLRDPELLSAQVRYLHGWIDTVAASTA